jgi:hypothetical protein
MATPFYEKVSNRILAALADTVKAVFNRRRKRYVWYVPTAGYMLNSSV